MGNHGTFFLKPDGLDTNEVHKVYFDFLERNNIFVFEKKIITLTDRQLIQWCLFKKDITKSNLWSLKMQLSNILGVSVHSLKFEYLEKTLENFRKKENIYIDEIPLITDIIMLDNQISVKNVKEMHARIHVIMSEYFTAYFSNYEPVQEIIEKLQGYLANKRLLITKCMYNDQQIYNLYLMNLLREHLRSLFSNDVLVNVAHAATTSKEVIQDEILFL